MLRRTSANVNVCNDLPNGPHLKIYDEIELLDSDAPLAPNLTQTFSAGEGNFAHFDWQLSYLHANALGHPPSIDMLLRRCLPAPRPPTPANDDLVGWAY
jgi:hypothetical protein